VQKISAWLNAARLRTLPLSVSGIITGTAIANYNQKNDYLIFILALLTTIAFQVTSNFANDYGDGVKGTDNEDRIGPKRALQSGILSRKELKNGIILAAILSILLVATLVTYAFGTANLAFVLLFLGHRFSVHQNNIMDCLFTSNRNRRAKCCRFKSK